MSQKLKNLSKLAALLLAGIALFLLGHFTTLHHSLTGTYSAAAAPDPRNAYVVLHADESFMIYDQDAVLVSGHYEAAAQEAQVYALIDEANEKVGYVVQDGKQIVLLGVGDTDQVLEKISGDALYLHDLDA